MSAAEGVLLVDKPAGMTSHDVVEVVRRKLGIRRVGHTGTLDPLAEGLLVLLVGSATKHQRTLQSHDKTYEATLRLGTQTDTADAEGAPVRQAPVPPLDRARIESVLHGLTGRISQTPPAYSAVKVGGRPAYWWARKRRPVTLTARPVEISALSLLDWTPETITFRTDCSAGTYIRSLGEAIAERLGTVGHINRLARLRVGHWSVQDARPLSWVSRASAEAIGQELRAVPVIVPVDR